MKKVFFCTALLVGSFAVKAQQNQLEQSRELIPLQVLKVGEDDSSATYEVKLTEASTGDFHRDPIAFMNRNLNLNDLIHEFDADDELFSFIFKSRKGILQANYNKKGKLLSTSLKFKDVILPRTLRDELYRDYKGWVMVSNKYQVKGNSTSIKKQTYHVKLRKGNLTKNLVFKKDYQV